MKKYPAYLSLTSSNTQSLIYPSKLLKRLFKNNFKLAKTVLETWEDVPEAQRALELINKAIFSTLDKLIDPSIVKKLNTSIVTQKNALEATLHSLPNELALDISPSFFAAPDQLPILTQIAPIYTAWLTKVLGLTKEEATKISSKIPSLFFETVVAEWANNQSYYQPIIKALDSPFSKRWETLYHQNIYYKKIKQHYQEDALGDNKLPLSKIYISPYFSIHKKSIPEDESKDLDFTQDNFFNTFLTEDISKEDFEKLFKEEGDLIKKFYKETSIHTYLNILLQEEKCSLGLEPKKLIFLLGQPGQGKSSFCYRQINDLLEDEAFKNSYQLCFLKFKEFSDHQQLLKDPWEEISKELQKEKIEFSPSKKSLLLLDGLDELYMSEGLTNHQLKDFYKALERQVDRADNQCTIIVTSRYHYLDLDDILGRLSLILRLTPLSLSQQLQWLKIYQSAYPLKQLTANKIKEIHKTKKLEHIKELIEQPILLHLIAKIDLEINPQLNKAEIYDNLFKKLLQRSWEKGNLQKLEKLSESKNKNKFRYWLQEIAFSIYNSPYEYINEKQFLALKSTAKIIKEIDTCKAEDKGSNTNEQLKEALKDLLISFYFQNKPQNSKEKKENDSNFAIELLHKSLQEYLAAEYLWRKIKLELTTQDSEEDYIINSHVDLLELFTTWFSNKSISANVQLLLGEIIKNDNSPTKEEVGQRLTHFLPRSLSCQFLHSYDCRSKEDPFRLAQNTAFGYYFTLGLTAPKTTFIPPSQIKNIRNYLPLISSYNKKGKFIPFNLREADLSVADLTFANLSGVYLTFANLSGVNLTFANLSRVNLRGAELRGAELRGADLRGADLTGADLSFTNLLGTELRGANLSGVYLSGAKLTGTKLTGAKLTGADLTGTKLTGADLSNAVLLNAKTENINFLEDLKILGVIGYEDIIKKYKINKNKQYYPFDTKKEHPYYLIIEK